MNRLTTLDINKLTPYAVGFDRVFDDMFKYIEHNTSSTGYPPYNIIRDGEKFQIEIALAGFSKKDIDVSYEDGVITVKSIQEAKQDGDQSGVLHKGISKRMFTKSFSIADDVEVKGAELKDGLLTISLEIKIMIHFSKENLQYQMKKKQ